MGDLKERSRSKGIPSFLPVKLQMIHSNTVISLSTVEFMNWFGVNYRNGNMNSFPTSCL